jgi:hypothetical protein
MLLEGSRISPVLRPGRRQSPARFDRTARYAVATEYSRHSHEPTAFCTERTETDSFLTRKPGLSAETYLDYCAPEGSYKLP